MIKFILFFFALTFGSALMIEKVNAQTNTKNGTPQSFSRTFQTDLNKTSRKIGLKNRRDMRQNNQQAAQEDDRTVGQSKTTNQKAKQNRRNTKETHKAPSSAQNSSASYGSALNN